MCIRFVNRTPEAFLNSNSARHPANNRAESPCLCCPTAAFYNLFLRSGEILLQNGEFHEKPRQRLATKTPSISNRMQLNENVGKTCFVDYESPPLTAEL
jgi:hypothetical protein